jgi:hypothetical protein
MRSFRVPSLPWPVVRVSLVLFALIPVLVIAEKARSSPATGPIPLAFYPLQNDDLDATGNNEPIRRVNAPFQNGGVYCNGIYGTSEACDVTTPELSEFNFDSFATSVDFMIDQYPSAEVGIRPILVCGYDYRYLGTEILSNGHILLLYNNSNTKETSQTVTLGVWHHVLITYGEPAGTAKLYLDDEFLDSAVFQLEHGDDRDVSVVNPSNGKTFLGTIRNMVVYQSAFDPTPVEAMTWGQIKSLY